MFLFQNSMTLYWLYCVTSSLPHARR